VVNSRKQPKKLNLWRHSIFEGLNWPSAESLELALLILLCIIGSKFSVTNPTQILKSETQFRYSRSVVNCCY
jgi:hypothetical protein